MPSPNETNYVESDLNELNQLLQDDEKFAYNYESLLATLYRNSSLISKKAKPEAKSFLMDPEFSGLYMSGLDKKQSLMPLIAAIGSIDEEDVILDVDWSPNERLKRRVS